MTRAVAYIRVSTDKQADAGVSLDAQRAKIEAYATLYDLDVVEVITDAGVSAKTLERDGLNRALARLDTGEADALIVVKLDRLTRSVADLGRLIDAHFSEKHGAALLSVSEQIDTRSAAGRLVLNVLTSVAQWERETTAERTRDAMRHKKAKGEYTGGHAPYGYTVEQGVLKADEVEQAVIAHAVELRTAGFTLRQVAEALAARGFTTRNGKPFQATQISRMVTSDNTNNRLCTRSKGTRRARSAGA